MARRKSNEPDHVGASLDLFVEPFQRVGCVNPGPVLLGKDPEGEAAPAKPHDKTASYGSAITLRDRQLDGRLLEAVAVPTRIR